jgi:hypothetical protein
VDGLPSGEKGATLGLKSRLATGFSLKKAGRGGPTMDSEPPIQDFSPKLLSANRFYIQERRSCPKSDSVYLCPLISLANPAPLL